MICLTSQRNIIAFRFELENISVIKYEKYTYPLFPSFLIQLKNGSSFFLRLISSVPFGLLRDVFLYIYSTFILYKELFLFYIRSFLSIFKYTHILPILKQNKIKTTLTVFDSSQPGISFCYSTEMTLPMFINELFFKSGIFKSLLCLSS